MERSFSVLQAQFQVLWKQSQYWDDKFGVRISEVCVTFHNMLFCMDQYGEFQEELNEDKGDVIT